MSERNEYGAFKNVNDRSVDTPRNIRRPKNPNMRRNLPPEHFVKMQAAKRLKCPIKPLAERFEAKVDRNGPNGCRQWLGAIRTHGYGHIFIRQEGDKPVTMLAHLAALMLAGIERPVYPLVVDHICKNMGCVNVAHMRIVTQTFNCTDHSDSPFGINKRKTHCSPHGHEFTPENTQRNARGHRTCRACRALRLAKYASRRAAA